MGKIQPHGGRKDANQNQITTELTALGYRVDDVSQLKKLYDMVITGHSINGVKTVRVEVKMPKKKLTPDEQAYHDADPFHETLIIAYCANDVLRWFGRIK